MTQVLELPNAKLDNLNYYNLLEDDGLSDDDIMAIIEELDEDCAAAIYSDWHFWARKGQQIPKWDWRFWVLKGGRGSGKTWCGANLFNEWAEKYPRLILVGRTAADVRDIMVEGESGLLATAKPNFRPTYIPGKRKVVWPNGAEALAISADEPDLLRGPNAYKAWADEMAAWRRLKETWTNLKMCLRIGDSPQCIITTTPRPLKEFKELLTSPTTHVTTESTYANVHNLAPQWADEVIRIYRGTRLGQQELEGVVLDDNPNALWKSEFIDDNRVERAPDLDRVIVAVDPPIAENDKERVKDPDKVLSDCGIIAAGRKGKIHEVTSQAYVLEDASLRQPKPEDWARQAVSLYYKYDADAIIAEGNNGGALVKSTIQAVDPHIEVIIVFASRGKVIRAEPVSFLYESKRVHHVGFMPELETQLCEWEPGMKSPDRLDADVWAITELLIGEYQKPVPMRTSVGGRKSNISQYPVSPPPRIPY